MQVSIISIAVNAVLTLFKLFVGIAAQSGAMVSDAVHSGSDVFSTLIVIAGVTVAEKRPDSGHPYGHERMECVASLLLAVILAATGIGIGAAGMKRIAEGGSLSVPGMAALLAALFPVPGNVFADMAEIHQCVLTFVYLENDVSAPSSIASVRTAVGDVKLAPE